MHAGVLSYLPVECLGNKKSGQKLLRTVHLRFFFRELLSPSNTCRYLATRYQTISAGSPSATIGEELGLTKDAAHYLSMHQLE